MSEAAKNMIPACITREAPGGCEIRSGQETELAEASEDFRPAQARNYKNST